MLTDTVLPIEDIKAICRKYGVTELAVFGSVLGDGFGPESDVDFLVTFRNNDAGPWAEKFMDLEAELAALLGRAVDVVDRRGVEQNRNPIIRNSILQSARVVYADPASAQRPGNGGASPLIP